MHDRPPIPKAPLEVYQDDDVDVYKTSVTKKRPVPIQIYCDDDDKENERQKTQPLRLTCRQPDFADKPEIAKNRNVSEENKENAHCGPNRLFQNKLEQSSSKTKPDGPLLPSKDVLYAPLDVQEKVLDDDEKEQEIALQLHQQLTAMEQARLPVQLDIEKEPINNANQTMFLPTAEDFEEMAKRVSTPVNGRRFIPEEEDEYENTCAVQLAFKKPLPVLQTEPQGYAKNNYDQEMDTYEVGEKNLSKKLDTITSANIDTNTVEHIPGKNAEDNQSELNKIDCNGENSDINPSQPENKMNMMSPIMETSREYNYKSSSSSSESQYHHHATGGNKSHWNGNNTTGFHQPNANLPNAIPGVNFKFYLSKLLCNYYFRRYWTLYQVKLFFILLVNKDPWINVAIKINIF